MAARFTGKVALVTGGGSSGIGRATALAFAREGATVLVAGRNPEALAHTVKLIQADGGHASAATGDVTHADDVARLVKMAVACHGGLHAAFNNAGILGTPGLVADLDQATWAGVLATNLTGVWLSMKHEIIHMRANGGGVIVNMASSIGVHMTLPGLGAYAAAKAGVSTLTRTAAREYIRDGIRINAVSPDRSTRRCRACPARPTPTATPACRPRCPLAASPPPTRSPPPCCGWPPPNPASPSATTSSSTEAPTHSTTPRHRRPVPTADSRSMKVAAGAPLKRTAYTPTYGCGAIRSINGYVDQEANPRWR